MVAVYSHIATPRLQYVLQFLSDYYSHPFVLFTDREVFLEQDAIRLNYSDEAIADCLQISPVGLLEESGVRPVAITCVPHTNGYPAFFSSEGAIGFDLFAAVFFLLSRYEEYLPHQKDMYGRYAHENSLAFQNGFLHLPLVNIWLEDFRKLLHEMGVQLPLRQFSFLPTYDIDMAWSYLHKGITRNLGGVLKSIISGKAATVANRLSVLRGKAPDPFYCFDWLDEVHRFYSLQPLYFFHVGKERNQYDKSIPTTNETFRQLIKDTGRQYKTGLHPSWRSGDAPSLIASEKSELETILSQPVSFSRQHYIRFTLPQTFRQLIATGITEDYSMGYGSINGFRASVAASFYWYDLQKEETTNLKLNPFCFMDANAYYEQKLTATEAYTELLQYYTAIKKVGGDLITIWHNNILGSDPEFVGWKGIYQRFLEELTTAGSALPSGSPDTPHRS